MADERCESTVTLPGVHVGADIQCQLESGHKGLHQGDIKVTKWFDTIGTPSTATLSW